MLFTAGDRIDYSNEGYMLLGRIIEKVSGQPYAEYLNAHVFAPLGMTNSGLDRSELVLKQRATGYLAGPGGNVSNAPCSDPAGAFSAGGMYSTVHDLCLFDQALYGETLLKQATLREAFTPVRLNDGREGMYGYGWMVRRFRGLLEVGHGGDIEGFNAYLLRFPEEQCAVIVLSNLGMRATGKLPTAGDLAHRVASLVLKDALQPEAAPATVPIEPALLDRYIGIYEYDAPPPLVERMGKTLTITREGNVLIGVDKTGRAELVAESSSVFSPKGSPVKLTFKTEGGQVTQVVITISGLKEIIAKRVN